MSYSITTKDGITISDIPDDIKPDDQLLKDHVAKIRSGTLEKPGALKSAAAGLGYGTGQVGLTLQELAGKGLSALGAEETGKALQEDVEKGRRKLKEEFFPHQVANPYSAGAGEFASEAALTAPVGGVIAKPFMAAAKYAPVAGRIGQAIESAGFNVAPAETLLGKAGNAALRVGGGAVTGGAAAGLVNPEDVGSGAMAGGAFGAAAKPIGALLGAGLRKYATPTTAAGSEFTIAVDEGMNKLANEIGMPVNKMPQETVSWVRQQLLDAYRQGKEIDPAALLRKADFQALGIQPMRGQITRDAAQYAQERNLRGAMPELQERLTEQNRTLQDLFARPAANAQEAYQAGSTLMNELGAQERSMRSQVSDLYRQARASAGKDLEIPMQGLAQDFGDVMSRYSQNVLNALPIKEFEKYGLMGGKQTKLYTVEEADKLLKTINANKSNDPAVVNALNELRDAVKKSVMQVDEGGGVFAPAVRAAKERFTALEQIPGMEAVANKEALQKTFVNKYILQNQDVDAVKRLAETLRGTPAFDEAKAQMASDIRRAAFGENIAADSAIRPEMLAKKLREIGTEKMSAFFSPDEINRYQAAVRVANYIEKHPNAAPVNTSNTLVASLMQSPIAKVVGKYAGKLPGADVAVAAANAVISPIKHEIATNRALKAEIPTTNIELNEAQRKLLAKVLGGTGAAAGLLGQ